MEKPGAGVHGRRLEDLKQWLWMDATHWPALCGFSVCLLVHPRTTFPGVAPTVSRTLSHEPSVKKTPPPTRLQAHPVVISQLWFLFPGVSRWQLKLTRTFAVSFFLSAHWSFWIKDSACSRVTSYLQWSITKWSCSFASVLSIFFYRRLAKA